MTTLPQLDYVHLEVRPGGNFSVLLGNFDQLSHVLHAPHRLADLPSQAKQGLATVRKFAPVLLEVRLLPVLLLAGRGALTFGLGQLHQVGHLV